MPNLDSILNTQSLYKRFGKVPALSGVNINIQAGEIHGLIGLNGSGKTTTLECCLGLLKFDEGGVDILGRTPDRVSELNGAVVFVSDTPSLFPQLTVRQNLEYVAKFTTSVARNPADVEELLGIAKYQNYKIKHLSLGNKRRTSLAQALLGNPKLVVFDEAFNGLDAQGIEDLLQVLKQQNLQNGTTFLLASHQLAYLERICSHISVLHRRQIQLSEALDVLLKSDEQIVQILSAECAAIADYVAEHPSIKILDVSTETTMKLRLSALSSAELNSTLVHAGFAIDELVMQRKSLRSVFQNATDTSVNGIEVDA